MQTLWPPANVRVTDRWYQGCHWTFATITENLCVRAFSQKMNTKRDRKLRKNDEIGENREWIRPKITENRHPCYVKWLKLMVPIGMADVNIWLKSLRVMHNIKVFATQVSYPFSHYITTHYKDP